MRAKAVMVGLMIVVAVGVTALAVGVGDRSGGPDGAPAVGLAADLDAATAAGVPAYVLIHSDG